MPRKQLTDLNLKQIQKLIEKKRQGPEKNLLTPIGIGVLLNEVGIIFLKGNEEAENELVSLLDYPIGARLAYSYLIKRKNQLKASTLTSLEKFEKTLQCR